jgi:hypothetical protein
MPSIATLILGKAILVGPLITEASFVGSNCALWQGQIRRLFVAS